MEDRVTEEDEKKKCRIGDGKDDEMKDRDTKDGNLYSYTHLYKQRIMYARITMNINTISYTHIHQPPTPPHTHIHTQTHTHSQTHAHTHPYTHGYTHEHKDTLTTWSACRSKNLRGMR